MTLDTENAPADGIKYVSSGSIEVRLKNIQAKEKLLKKRKKEEKEFKGN